MKQANVSTFHHENLMDVTNGEERKTISARERAAEEQVRLGEEGINYGNATPFEAVLRVFRKEDLAAGRVGDGEDDGIVDLQVMTGRQFARCLEIVNGGGKGMKHL